MKVVAFGGAGGNEVIRLEERADPEPRGEEVGVKVRFAALNPADIWLREGRYDPPPGRPQDVPGAEVAGIIECCGSDVTMWKPGERVFGLVSTGGLANRVTIDQRYVTRVPDTLGEREAAAVPMAFITAHDALCTTGRLTMSEVLLVHGGTGGVGTAAIQLGRALGARVLAPVRSESAAQEVQALGAEAIPAVEFVSRALELTDGAGVDVVLEVVGALHFPGDVEVLAPKGRIVVVGVGGAEAANVPLLTLIQKRGTIHGMWLRRPPEERAAAIRAFERQVVPALAKGILKPLVGAIYPASEAAAAFERLEHGPKVGKVLVEF